MTKKRSAAAFLCRHALALTSAAGVFALTYTMVFGLRNGNSDFYPHILWALNMDKAKMLRSLYNGSERLWHICMRLANAFVPNIWQAAALTTAAANTAAYCLVYGAFARSARDRTARWLLALAALCPFFISSLTLPGHTFYSGRGAVTTWHNPTTIMVRPFAAAVLYMTVNIYNRRRYGQPGPLIPLDGEATPFAFSGGFWAQFRAPVFTRAELVLYPLCLLCSLWAKPSFMQVFAPAIFLFLLIDVIRTKGKLLPFCIKLALAYLPAALLLLRQFGNFFSEGLTVGAAQTAAAVAATEESSGIGVYIVPGPWTGFGPVLEEIFYRFKTTVLPCAFPLFLLLAAPKRTLRCASFRLGVVCAAVGLLEVLLLHETGARAGHGNMNWGNYLACWLFWTTAVGQYVQLLREKTFSGRAVLTVGTGLLLWHICCGVCYAVLVLEKRNFFF